MHQDASLLAARFDPGGSARHELAPGRQGWVQVVRGEVTANGETLRAGDGAALSEEAAIELRATADAEVLVFDLA